MAATVRDDQAKPGDIIDGNYELKTLLGSGGMGSVYACRHIVLDKEYAIKILSGRSVTPELWTRFQKEAKVLAKLDHPGIVKIHNMGIDEGLTPYYVMDLLSGESLADLIKRSKYLPVAQALTFFIEVAGALSSAHSKGIIHRDIKPSNLMVIRNKQDKIERIKIVDFGIARWSKQAAETQSQTATGLTIGTPFYMSPEQCQGTHVDERSDIYSLGCALFQALTGEPPFRGENAFQTFMMHQNDTPPRLKSIRPAEDYPAELEMAIEKMLRKSAEARYQTMEQVEQILLAISKGDVAKKRVNKYAETSAGNSGKGAASSQGEGDHYTGKENIGRIARNAVLAVVATASGLAIVAGCLVYFLNPTQKNAAKISAIADKVYTAEKKPLGASLELKPSSKPFLAAGCTSTEIDHLTKYNFIFAHEQQEQVEHDYRRIEKEVYKPGFKFLDATGTTFIFPDNIIIGFLSFGEGKPIAASGKIRVKTGRRTFYQSYCLHRDDQFIDHFRPDDLQGLELTSHKLPHILQQLKNWKKLETLSFFNSLTRPMPSYESYDESTVENKDLKITNDLPSLKALGVCGQKVTGDAVISLPIMKRLKSLRIKRIKNYEALLTVLPQFPNLEEVWLLTLPITDDQLAPLTRMANLKSLYISRAAITPASIAMFARMPKLQKLRLNGNWSAAQKAALCKHIPNCIFDRPVETEYWQVLKGTAVAEYFKEQDQFKLPEI